MLGEIEKWQRILTFLSRIFLRIKNYSNFIEILEVKRFYREPLAHTRSRIYWLCANITKHRARKGLHHCNIVWLHCLRVDHFAVIRRRCYVAGRLFEPQSFAAANISICYISGRNGEKCCRLNICRALGRWLLEFLVTICFFTLVGSRARGTEQHQHRSISLTDCAYISSDAYIRYEERIQSIKRSGEKKA